MAKKPSKQDEAPSFETRMTELESIIDRIESGEVGLEESITAYERGIELVEGCRSLLASAEQRVEDLTARLDSGDDAQTMNEADDS